MTSFAPGPRGQSGIDHAALPPLAPTRARQRWGVPGSEPPLAEVLADPVVHLVMRGDGVTHTELEAIIRRAQDQAAKRA